MSEYKFNQNDFDREFLNIMGGFAEALEVDLPDMMQRMLIKRFAYDRAILDVMGNQHPDTYIEFMEAEDLESKKLFQILYNMKRQELERGRVEQIKATGIPFDMLPVEDQEILKRFNQDPETKKEKEEAEKEIQRMIDSGELSEPIIEWKDKKE